MTGVDGAEEDIASAGAVSCEDFSADFDSSRSLSRSVSFRVLWILLPSTFPSQVSASLIIMVRVSLDKTPASIEEKAQVVEIGRQDVMPPLHGKRHGKFFVQQTALAATQRTGSYEQLVFAFDA